MAKSNPSLDIAIVGGGTGISGLVLAIALQARDFNVKVYEQAHKFGEIGAGVAFSPNAVRAMEVCSPQVHAGFEKVCTRNQSPEKQTIWFDWLDGYHPYPVGKEKHLFSLDNGVGANAVHRAHFLDEMVKLVHEGTSVFNKRLETIVQTASGEGKLTMKFHDGSEATADAIIGCDGIKSRTRAWMFGEDHPSTPAVYTHKYAYRGLIPMEKAVEALGADNAQNAKMHMGKDGHVLTFPVDHGDTMNVVAFKTNHDKWPSSTKLTLPSKKEHVYEDFSSFGPTVQAIITLLKPNLDCWAIFDLGDNPLPTYTKGRVCLLGDSAHGTSPHHGAGAGICVEDVAVMAELLADQRVREQGVKGIETVFKAFDQSRRERTQWLVQSSRRSGDLYQWRTDLGDDIEKIGKECKERNGILWNAQIKDQIDDAKKNLGKILDDSGSA